MAKIVWHSTAPWAASGYGTQTAIAVTGLVSLGHEVIISSFWGLSGSPTQWNGVTVLPGFGGNYCSGSLGQHCKMIQPDLVISLSDIWVLDAGILRELPVAHWLPGDCRPMSLADRSNISGSGAQLVAMSKWGKDRFESAGYDPLYMPHSVNTELFKPGDRKAVRDKIGIPEDLFVIGINAANNDAIRKAIPEQMLAFAKLHNKYPDTVLALHSGVHQDGGQDLEALAENLGLIDCMLVADQYRYHSGMISPADLAEWYQSLDLLSATTFGEGFGIPIIEAQSCGIPVVTTDASAMTELNPYGISVSGQPFWNGVHKGWWIRPDIAQIADAYEKAYLSRGTEDPRLREFALEYDIPKIRDEYLAPVTDELLSRMEKKKLM